MSSVASLPPELLLEIFGYLTPEELLDNVQNVCTYWRELVRCLPLWEDYVYVYRPRRIQRYVGDVLVFLKKCPMLKHIDFHSNSVIEPDALDEIISAIIKNISDLRTFRVGFEKEILGRHIDAIFKAFPNLECFETIINSENPAEVFSAISKCSNLKKLIIKFGASYGSYLRLIVDGCTSLEYLHILWHFKIANSEYEYILVNMKDRLTFLKFWPHQSVTHRGVDILSTFSKLEYLNLRHTIECGVVNYLPLANVRTVKEIDFRFNAPNYYDIETIFELLFHHPFPILETLSINFEASCWHRPVLKEICRCYPKLKKLTLVHRFGDKVNESFADICRLEHLERMSCGNVSITDDDVEYVSRCRRLKHLYLGDCGRLTDTSVSHLANCPSLEHIDLCNNAITGRTLHLFHDRMPRLRVLNLNGNNIDREIVCTFRSKMPLVQIIL